MDLSDVRRRVDFLNRTGVQRTLTGLTFMAVGTFLLWIPYIQYLGYLLNIAGVVLMYLGSDAFDAAHGSYIIASILLYFVATVILLIATSSFLSSMAQVLVGNASNSTKILELRSNLYTFISISGVCSSLVGLAFVLLTWKINDRTGHYLLLTGLTLIIGLTVVVGIFLFGYLSNVFTSYIDGASASSVISSLSAEKGTLYLVDAIPYTLFALTYSRTRSNITNLSPALNVTAS